ncbi:hypothetical protein Y1Q_0005053 [Alligator mississippiensis]|uniref:Uncharacterized protein n=1 Tax=Alligator mississippiensis TaxID=8496 RepID=A0A151MP82_ALLMI|nr:hypothetical protein Y1Q_0005053 [Alligator mississippiensis]
MRGTSRKKVHHLKGEMAVIHDVHEKKQMSDIQEQLKTTSSGEIKAETRNSNLFQMETTQKSRYKEDFSQRLKLQKQALQLQHHLQNERENCLQRSKWMRERLIQSEALILQLEGKLYTMNGGDPELMAKVQKIQETNEAEVKQIQEETAAAYHQNLCPRS